MNDLLRHFMVISFSFYTFIEDTFTTSEIQTWVPDFMRMNPTRYFRPEQYGQKKRVICEYHSEFFFINWQAVKNSNNCLTKIGNSRKQSFRRLEIRPKSSQAVISL